MGRDVDCLGTNIRVGGGRSQGEDVSATQAGVSGSRVGCISALSAGRRVGINQGGTAGFPVPLGIGVRFFYAQGRKGTSLLERCGTGSGG